MRTAPAGEEFFLHDGSALRDVRELYAALGSMTDEDFSGFVNKDKHDFARWIELSLDDKFLAALARRMKSRKGLRKALFMRLYG